MPTINQLAARIANTLNQPTNTELIERAKDMVRSAYAAKIKEVIVREGVRDFLTTSFAINTVKADLTHFLVTGEIKPTTSTINFANISENKICVPVDINNDAPFTMVRTSNKDILYDATILARKPTLLPQWVCTNYYTISNGHLIVIAPDKVEPISNATYIFITGVFEDPSEILAKTGDPDNVELPIPASIIEDMLYTIFRVNFNMYPKNVEITISKDQIQSNGK